jgi:hypothetical protein
VQMEEWSWKEKVMKEKGKLRGNSATEKIFIENDVPRKKEKYRKKYEPSPVKKKEKEKM